MAEMIPLNIGQEDAKRDRDPVKDPLDRYELGAFRGVREDQPRLLSQFVPYGHIFDANSNTELRQIANDLLPRIGMSPLDGSGADLK